jgi:hypothetical protein
MPAAARNTLPNMALRRLTLLCFLLSALCMDSTHEIAIERITGIVHHDQHLTSGFEDYGINVKPRFYNPSIVQYMDRFVVAVRCIQLYRLRAQP